MHEYAHLCIYIYVYTSEFVHMGRCFFDVAVPGGWYNVNT